MTILNVSNIDTQTGNEMFNNLSLTATQKLFQLS